MIADPEFSQVPITGVPCLRRVLTEGFSFIEDVATWELLGRQEIWNEIEVVVFSSCASISVNSLISAWRNLSGDRRLV